MAYTTIDKPTDYFNTKLYTGTGATHNITGVGFQPDWVWIKERNSAVSHHLYDSVRGATKRLESDNTDAETTAGTFLTSFDSDGFTLGSNGGLNGSSDTYVGWNWLAGGTAPTQTYTVKVVSDSGNKYRFDDFGTSAVTLDLQEGGTYTFDQSDSSNSGHPLRFSTTSDGTHGGGSEYTTNVTTTGTPGSAGAKTVITVASGAATLYYYCTQHSGMGGQANTNSSFGSSNFSGDIQSTVSAGTTQGFSIVSYTGSGTISDTVGHGLGTTPNWIILKNRDTGTSAFIVHHSGLSSGYNMQLQSNGDHFNSTGQGHLGTVGSSTFGFVAGSSGNDQVNDSSEKYIAYCFAEKKGYSKFGSYTGNGSSDGTFVYTGFKSAFVICKSSGSGDWKIFDSKRIGYNAANYRLQPNNSNAETSDSLIDIFSNGFKLKTSSDSINSSSTSVIYMAFAENSFVTSTGIPTTAR